MYPAEYEYGEQQHLGITDYIRGIFGNALEDAYPELWGRGREWPRTTLYLTQGQKVLDLYALCVETPLDTLAPSWEIEVTQGNPVFGYLLAKPMTQEQWRDLNTGDIQPFCFAPLTQHRGEYARVFDWRPDLRYSLTEVQHAFSAQPALAA